MNLWRPETIDVAPDLSSLDAAIDAVPNRPAVFLVWSREGVPYLGRTTLLRRRLLRLLDGRLEPSRLLSLRSVVSRVEYRLTGSWLETNLLFHEQARRHFPDTYLRLMKLRMPPYVKIILPNPFPRSQVTNRISGGGSLYYGPFRSRGAAETFESQFLDLFQMRRCPEDLKPSAEHPGCIYGEMSMCLRPCQQVVGCEEYGAEVRRVVDFLSTDGRSLLEGVKHLRERLAAELNFEDAARQHKQVEKIQNVLKMRDELVSEIDRLWGIAITPSVAQGCVELWIVAKGCWQFPIRFSTEAADGRPVPLDKRLRDAVASVELRRISQRDRQEHLALLARWRYSSRREGEWIPFERIEEIPYRRLVKAIARVAMGVAD